MLCSRVIREGVRRFVSVRHASTSILSTDKLDATVDDKTGVCRLVMHSAPVNLLEMDVIKGIRDVVVEADTSPKIRALVLSSGLPRIFSAGFNDEAPFSEYWGVLQDIIHTTYIMKGVTVAAIDGTCIAGGLYLALALDRRIITEGKHQIGFVESQLGFDGPDAECEMFKHQCGLREAMSGLPTGEACDVTEAHRVGLIDEVCPPGGLDKAVENYLHKAMAIQTEAWFNTKQHPRKLPLSVMS